MSFRCRAFLDLNVFRQSCGKVAKIENFEKLAKIHRELFCASSLVSVQLLTFNKFHFQAPLAKTMKKNFSLIVAQYFRFYIHTRVFLGGFLITRRLSVALIVHFNTLLLLPWAREREHFEVDVFPLTFTTEMNFLFERNFII